MLRANRHRFLLVASLAVAAAGCDREADSSKPLMESADALTQAGKGVQAVKLLEGMAADTKDPRLLHQLALAHQAAGDLPAAAAALRRACALAPKHLPVRAQLATVLAMIGDADGARQHALELIAQAPNNSGGPLIFAAAARPQDLDAAIAHLERWRAAADANRSMLTSYEALVVLQDLHRRRGDTKKAAALTEAISRAKLSNPPGAMQLAHIFRHSARREVAEALLSAAGEADPKLPVWGTLAAVAADLGHLERAEAALGKLPEEQRGQPKYAAIRGSILLSRGNAAGAADVLGEAKRALPPAQRHGAISLLLAQALARDNRLQAAKDELMATKAAGSMTTTATFLLADVLRRLGEQQAAIAEVAPLLEAPQTKEEAYGKLVSMHTSGGDFDLAAQLAERWLAERPGHPPALMGLARAQIEAKQLGAARKTLEALLQQHPGTARAVDMLVATLRAQGQAARAEALILEQLELAPTTAMLDFAGYYLENNGKPREAEKLYRRALALDRSAPGPWARLARLFRSEGRGAQALAMYAEAIVRAPNDLALALESAPLEADAGNLEAAIARYEQVMAAGSEDAALMNNLAYLYAEQGKNLSRGLSLASMARTRLPDSAEVLDTLAWVHHRSGDDALALPLLRRAAEGLPQRANVAYHLGVVELAAGDGAAGRKQLERALVLEPAHTAARAALAALDGSTVP